MEAENGRFLFTVSDSRPQVIEFFSDLVVRTKSEISIGRRFASGLKGKQVYEKMFSPNNKPQEEIRKDGKTQQIKIWLWYEEVSDCQVILFDLIPSPNCNLIFAKLSLQFPKRSDC